MVSLSGVALHKTFNRLSFASILSFHASGLGFVLSQLMEPPLNDLPETAVWSLYGLAASTVLIVLTEAALGYTSEAALREIRETNDPAPEYSHPPHDGPY